MAMITVQVWDATGNKRQEVELPDDAPVNRILAVLLDKMNLPQVAPDGQLAEVQWTSISARAPAAGELIAVASRSHRDEKTNQVLEERVATEIVSAGSSLKFCLLAAGEADFYPRMGRTMEWDTAAGQAILVAAGGSVVTEDGAPLTYGKKERGYDNPHFIAQGVTS